MSIGRHDRLGDSEFNERTPDQNSLAAETLIGLLFLREGLPVTRSAAGEPRVRTVIYDPDGWPPNETTAGVAKLTNPDGGTIYVAEQEFRTPRKGGATTYMWRLNPRSHQLDLETVTAQGETVYSSGDPPSGTDPIADLEMRWSTFAHCIEGMMNPYFADHYDDEVRHFHAHAYAFRLKALRDNPPLPQS